ncbi:aromatic hydrocarbon degradation protein [Vibrio sp. 10N.286.49.B3]|uniref:outer membrane protein transport protein n=1 Tax=Vibrio sp. 10N.286.49.B3 TaxID=1880855 RepID=UPI000C8163D7|nr:outer membrane protein transport protein [Vibrio sp. 10N.286.49.B3]PMH41813.1 aromatic hydrocarbon degradation protein [Vibrio sp. 10N.286.49.B3]
MKYNRTSLSLAVIFGLLSHSATTNAAGFQLAEYSATGLGRAYAGEAAMADNASAQWRNPAMLTYLKGTQISTGAIYVAPNMDVSGTVTPPSTGGDISYDATSNDIAHNAVIPNFYLSHQINQDLFFGFALGTNYGMETDLGSDFAGSHFGDQASIMTMEVNANLAYQLTDAVSIGGGIRYVLGEGHFGATLPDHISGGNDITLKYMEGDDTAWGYQLGAAWQVNDDHRIGVTYKSEVMMDFAGHANGIGFGEGADTKLPGKLSIALPQTVEIASFHQLTDRWAMHASVNWTDWSSFEQLVAELDELGSSVIKDENWEDNYRFAIGATYLYSPKLTLRTGIAYDMSAVSDKNRTATIPETDRTWFSAGASYAFSSQFSLDAGLTYIHAKEAAIYEPRGESDDQAADIGGAFEGSVSGDIWLAGLQFNYIF